MAEPLVTIMMPVFNAERYVGAALDSILDQTYSRWELLVIDDGSTDRSAEILANYRDRRIRAIHQPNQGEAVARNRALDEAKGELLAFLDADDQFLPQHLERLVQQLQAHPECGGVYSDGYYIDAGGKRMEKLSSQRRGPFNGEIFEELVRASDVFGPPICTLLSMGVIRDHALEFDPQITIGPDWDFMTRFAMYAGFVYLDETTCLYRVHETNVTLTTTDHKRHESLARCREKTIKSPLFDRCSVETRSYAFYDLLLNHLFDDPERREAITQWPEFRALPSDEQARLHRLMATDAIVHSKQTNSINRWIEQAVELDPYDLRSLGVASLYKLSPALCRAFLRVRKKFSSRIDTASPFNIQ